MRTGGYAVPCPCPDRSHRLTLDQIRAVISAYADGELHGVDLDNVGVLPIPIKPKCIMNAIPERWEEVRDNWQDGRPTDTNEITGQDVCANTA